MNKLAAEKIASEYYNIGVHLALQHSGLLKVAKPSITDTFHPPASLPSKKKDKNNIKYYKMKPPTPEEELAFEKKLMSRINDPRRIKRDQEIAKEYAASFLKNRKSNKIESAQETNKRFERLYGKRGSKYKK